MIITESGLLIFSPAFIRIGLPLQYAQMLIKMALELQPWQLYSKQDEERKAEKLKHVSQMSGYSSRVSEQSSQWMTASFLSWVIFSYKQQLVPCSLKYGLSVQFSSSVVSDSLWPHEPQNARPPYPSPTPGVHPNPLPLNQWCHPTISFSVVPFSSFPQSFPASGSFQMSQLFTSGGQSIGVSASTSVLPVNTQVWSPLVFSWGHYWPS